MGETALRACRTLCVLVLLAGGCSSGPPDLGVGPFQGNWKWADAGGKRSIQAAFEKDLVQIVEQTGTKARRIKGTFRVNPPATSGEIDIVETSGANVGKTRLGVFAFEGDTLKICLADLEIARPAGFVEQEGCTLMVLERVK
jgi:uncharacterized protein (TIGR03067 family)